MSIKFGEMTITQSAFYEKGFRESDVRIAFKRFPGYFIKAHVEDLNNAEDATNDQD